MQLFYTTNIQGGFAILEQEEARHCAQVLRKKVGDSINFTDGKGSFYKGTLTELSKKQCLLAVESVIPTEKRPFSLHIAIAPTKNINRLEWFLEKATEIGIDTITPIWCQHSERNRIRLDRLEKIIVTAMKQSLKARLPSLQEAMKFSDLLPTITSTHKYIAHCTSLQKDALKNNYQASNDVTILIGPEGDFSPVEITQAFEYGFSGISLGKERLRTETAALVACHSINFMNQ